MVKCSRIGRARLESDNVELSELEPWFTLVDDEEEEEEEEEEQTR
jgi:hypothetical protein